MSSIFRLRYYLRRSGEKQPLLLLEPILTSAASEFFLSDRQNDERGDEGSTEPKRLQNAEPGPAAAARQWYLYQEGGACESIELRKLHALQTSQMLLQQLVRELRREGLSSVGPERLEEELRNLWQGSVKGIALRQLEQGQVLASEGVWLVSERSFYALLPCDDAMEQQLHNCKAEQRVTLQEQSTGHSYSGLLAVVEAFDLPSSDQTSSDPTSPPTTTAQTDYSHLVLCRLRLDRRTLISMKQAVTDTTGAIGATGTTNRPQNLYKLCFLAGQDAERQQKQTVAPHADSARQLYSWLTEQNRASDCELLLFVPVNSVDSSQALHKFLADRLPALGLAALERGSHSQNLFCQLEDLAACFIGWGEARKQLGKSWERLGAWRIQADLLQKYGSFIYQRARQFGGYPQEKLVKELGDALPQAVLKSLLAYLCGARQKAEDQESELRRKFYHSCTRVDGYLIALETMHPAAYSASYSVGHPGLDSPTDDSAKQEGKLNLEPSHISPQGRQMLQEIWQAGEQGLPLYQLQKDQLEVIQALLRSGWVVSTRQNHGSAGRCYARSLEPENLAGKLPQNKRQPYLEAKGQSKDQSLEATLASYKKMHQLRQRKDSDGSEGYNKHLAKAPKERWQLEDGRREQNAYRSDGSHQGRQQSNWREGGPDRQQPYHNSSHNSFRYSSREGDNRGSHFRPTQQNNWRGRGPSDQNFDNRTERPYQRQDRQDSRRSNWQQNRQQNYRQNHQDHYADRDRTRQSGERPPQGKGQGKGNYRRSEGNSKGNYAGNSGNYRGGKQDGGYQGGKRTGSLERRWENDRGDRNRGSRNHNNRGYGDRNHGNRDYSGKNYGQNRQAFDHRGEVRYPKLAYQPPTGGGQGRKPQFWKAKPAKRPTYQMGQAGPGDKQDD